MIYNKINIQDKHLEIIKAILKKNSAESTKIWVFGSRVENNCKPFSDLDIALQHAENKTIPLKIVANLKSDFIDSDLPWKVDVIDYNSISGVFKKNVDASKIKLSLD